MEKLKNIIETSDTKAGRIFDLFIQLLIVISLISFLFETLPKLNSEERVFLRILETIIVVIFTIEYLLRLIVSDKKFKYIFSFNGLIDLAAILPFYISTGIDLRSIRIFRLFRMFRILKIVRYNKAIDRFKNAFLSIKNELIIFMITTVFLLYITGVGFYYFENRAQPEVVRSAFDGLWWAVITLTTVGYGDVYPITVGGKFFTFVLLMIGLGIIAVPSGLLASALSKVKE